MSAPIDLDPDLIVVGSDVVPAPTLLAVVQVGVYVEAVVTLPALTGSAPITSLRIYRAPTLSGPWTFADANAPSPISTYNNLFDLDPAIGHAMWYAATAVNSNGSESAFSAALSISAAAT